MRRSHICLQSVTGIDDLCSDTSADASRSGQKKPLDYLRRQSSGAKKIMKKLFNMRISNKRQHDFRKQHCQEPFINQSNNN